MAIDDAIDEMKVPEKIDLEEEPEEIVEELTKQEKLPIIVKDLCEKISELVDYDTKELSEYNDDISGISVIVNSVKEAIQIWEKNKVPIALKIHSEIFTHKTEIKGVAVNLDNAMEIREKANEFLQISHLWY